MLLALAAAAALSFVSADGSKIAGTLSFPSPVSGHIPAVVLIGTNGPADRNEMAGTVPVFQLYAQALNANGFAVLRYDNRGIGESTTATRATAVRRQNFIDDAAAAVKAVASEAHIDSRRIYLLGLSEGADTAMAVAQEGGVRGLVLVGPLSVPYAQALAEQDAAAPPDVRQRDELLLALPYFRSYEGIDPRKEVAVVQQPMLIARGLNDTQTSAADFDDFVKSAQTAGRTAVVKRYPGADHFLLSLSAERRLEFDPAAAASISSWLRSH